MQDIPIVSFVAWSGTGKTTFLEKLIPALKARGLRLCVMKHDAHEFQADREGKDSWRMTRAGADVTIVTNGKHAAVFENRPVSAEALLARVEGVDLILTEGYKHGPLPCGGGQAFSLPDGGMRRHRDRHAAGNGGALLRLFGGRGSGRFD